MPRKRVAPAKRDRLGDLLRLQHRLVGRSADYARRLGDLAAQGAVEPRPYVSEWFGFWSGVLDDVGDWWKPKPERAPETGLLPVARKRYEMRRERGDFRFEVPAEVFDARGDGTVILLSTDGLVRTFDPKRPLRPMVTLAPEQNVRIDPPAVTRADRRKPELKIFGVAAIVEPRDVYGGVIWGATKRAPKQRFPVAMIELEIV